LGQSCAHARSYCFQIWQLIDEHFYLTWKYRDGHHDRRDESEPPTQQTGWPIPALSSDADVIVAVDNCLVSPSEGVQRCVALFCDARTPSIRGSRFAASCGYVMQYIATRPPDCVVMLTLRPLVNVLEDAAAPSINDRSTLSKAAVRRGCFVYMGGVGAALAARYGGAATPHFRLPTLSCKWSQAAAVTRLEAGLMTVAVV
jgi:hypothetical protein